MKLWKLGIGAAVVAVALGGMVTSKYADNVFGPGEGDSAENAVAAATPVTTVFTNVHTVTDVNTVTYTPETVTETVTVPQTTTAPPPTTTEPPVTTTEPSPPPVTQANLWIDTNGGTCVRKATPAAYIDAEACTWGGAADKGLNGDLALVKGGSYGDRTIDAAGGVVRTSAMTIKTAPGETVVLGSLDNGRISNFTGSSWINFVGPAKSTEFRNDTVSNVSIDNWEVDCNGCTAQAFHVESASNVLVKNSKIHDNINNPIVWINGTNLTFENNEIYDARLPSGSSAHTECMYVQAVTNLTLKRNHFHECAVMDVFITGSAVSTGGFIENNHFEAPVPASGLAFHFRNGGAPSPDPQNWQFRYNTFGPEAELSISSENTATNVTVMGNDWQGATFCSKAGATFSFNRGCGGITTTLNQGNPNDFPAVDKNGVSRPQGPAPDIGAFEVG